jgi:AraC-like DNA-binding protein
VIVVERTSRGDAADTVVTFSSLPPSEQFDAWHDAVSKAFIDARLDDPELTTATIAAAHYISPRYLQKLFEAEGSTVTDWIRRRRLDHCKRELLDPRNAGSPSAGSPPAGVWRTRRTSPGCSARPTACHRGSSGRKRSPWPDRSGSLSGHGGRIGEDPQREPPGPGAGRPALVASRVVPGCVNPRRGCWRPAGRETCRILRLCLSNLIIQVNPKRRTLELSSLLGVFSLFSRCDRGRDRQSGILCLTSRPTELT